MSKNVFQPNLPKKNFSCNANAPVSFKTLLVRNSKHKCTLKPHLHLYHNMKLIKTDFILTQFPNNFNNHIIQGLCSQ